MAEIIAEIMELREELWRQTSRALLEAHTSFATLARHCPGQYDELQRLRGQLLDINDWMKNAVAREGGTSLTLQGPSDD